MAGVCPITLLIPSDHRLALAAVLTRLHGATLDRHSNLSANCSLNSGFGVKSKLVSLSASLAARDRKAKLAG